MNSPFCESAFSATIRPIIATSVDGLIFIDNHLLAIDSRNGYLLLINPKNSVTKIVNNSSWQDFIGAKGLCISENKLWFTSREYIYYCSIEWEKDNLVITSKPFCAFSLSYPANGIAVWENTIYITTQKTGHILVYSLDGTAITKFYAPGIGAENITVKGEEIWLCDSIEQTVYCLDRATGDVKYSILTPFESPTALAFCYDEKTGKDILYVAYSDQEPYIRDNPNAEPNHELLYRDRTFIHPLHFYFDEENKYTLSNGFLLEMTYVEEISPLDHLELKNLEWRIALPTESARQKIKSIEAVGLPYIEEDYQGQKVALFKFPEFNTDERYVFGWRAILEVWSIKYQLKPRDCEALPPLSPDYESKYLVDDDNLAMNTDVILRAAEDARGSETNLLRKMYNIRNYVYDHLTYGIKPHIDTPDIVLKRGVGSCGEYLGLLLALSRLNGIACRTVGRYKCPLKVLHFGIPLVPDFNHVWMEFYLPSIGWLPMESNPDDLEDSNIYPTRFFMGLSWYHVEMAKDVPFETLKSEGELINKETTSIGQLAINHVSFTIIEELKPTGSEEG
ncbi:transglutaminase family protein [Cyanobacterium aponinum UTEX 3222]|uniref:Transglutaminase domain-containing protein n=2 Tax=Cyanobacterium aponinum TaxID=379064 RepID=K9Z318_CYAAP|nr:transglutaminase family protein [Cyanobacterium aponinum]WRL41088.1 transglutaminase family protein [Cyanobacterium aponinum UTEX 3222]AFZ53117.1 transglutaminase domain-containing protein [Cyanobacterium aponinum PCC 10605]MBD2395312.1 transglutaminase family protein [Cyanobacterium aponinum FACHB-4101]MTF40506.1 transglutaminase [Cyanobacterium aponinum 0216]PHV62745.1 transglutaminase family protein [Cyanobacterium aponinum IPPAS B-1201]